MKGELAYLRKESDRLSHLQGLIDGAEDRGVHISGHGLVTITVNDVRVGIGDTLREAIDDSREKSQ